LIEQHQMRPQKSDITHAKESTTEKQQCVLQLAVTIKDITGQQKKRKEETASMSKSRNKPDAQGGKERKHSKKNLKKDTPFRKNHPGIFLGANRNHQDHNQKK